MCHAARRFARLLHCCYRPRVLEQNKRGRSVKNVTVGGWQNRLRRYFPDREFFMRSQGHVRFITISSQLQMVATLVAAMLLLSWLAAMATMALSRTMTSSDRIDLLNREARVVNAESRVTAYRKGIDTVASDLTQRQEAMEKLVQVHVGTLPNDQQAGETVSDSSKEAARTVAKVSAAVPGAAGLARIEARQLAFAERLTKLADRRAARASALIRKLGLSPAAMLAARNDTSAQGGPLIPLFGSAQVKLDGRFERLGLSLARMTALERSLTMLPQYLPARMDYISSGFGYRADPFTGGAAFHAGLDFRGPYGAPIYAAAKGRVAFAGVKPGYGNCVEIDHGNGLMTRYAHMSAFRTHRGDQVLAGSAIGSIGNSGRSTGPHLHFEVRIHDRPVNPRPFLEAATHVSQKTSIASAVSVAG